MLFWIVTAAVVVVLFALAWWSSGRAKGTTLDRRRAVDNATAESKARSAQHTIMNGGRF